MLSTFARTSTDALLGYLQDFRGDRALLVRTLYLTANAFAPLSPLALSYLSWSVFQEEETSADDAVPPGRTRDTDEDVAAGEWPADQKSAVGTRLGNIMDRIVWDFDADLRNFSPLIDLRQGRVTLIHASVKDFLDNGETFSQIRPFLGSSLKNQSTDIEIGSARQGGEMGFIERQDGEMRSTQNLVHVKMAVACLEYLFALFEDREREFSIKGTMTGNTRPKPVYRDQLSFLEYAAAHWRDHASHCRARDPELRKLVDELFDPRRSKYSSWRDQLLDSHDYSTIQAWPDDSLREQPGVWVMANYCALDLCHVLETPNTIDFDWQLDTFLQWLGLAAANAALYSIDWLLRAASSFPFVNPVILEAHLEGPMCEAARHGRLKSLLRLLEHFDGTTTFSCRLHEAARDGGHDEIFMFLFDPEQHMAGKGWTRRNFVPLDTRAEFISAFKTALTLHYANAVDYLLSHGGLDSESLESEGILSWVVEANNSAAFDKLLDAGVDVHAEYNGEQPIHVASRLGREEILEMILTDKRADASRVADKTVANPQQLTVDAVVEKSNTTSLQLACQGGFASICKQLLEAGAAVNPRDKQGLSAAHYAACSGNDIIMSMLVGSGANINVRTRDGETPLHMAVRQERESVVQVLLEIGSDMGLANKQGETALHLAVRSNNPTLVRLLLDHGAIVDVKDDFGRTPLHRAAQGPSDLICKELLHAGASINTPDIEGKTPLDYCVLSPTRIEAVSTALREAGGVCNFGIPKDGADSQPLREDPTTIQETAPKDEQEPTAVRMAKTASGAESDTTFFILPSSAWVDASEYEDQILGTVVKDILKPWDEYVPKTRRRYRNEVEESSFADFRHDSSESRNMISPRSARGFSFVGNVEAAKTRLSGELVQYKRLATDHQELLRQLMSDAGIRTKVQRWTSKSRIDPWPTCLVVGILIGKDMEVSYSRTESVSRAAAASARAAENSAAAAMAALGTSVGEIGWSTEREKTVNRSSTVRSSGSKIFALQLKRIVVRGILRKELEIKNFNAEIGVKADSAGDSRKKDSRFGDDDLKRRGSTRDFGAML